MEEVSSGLTGGVQNGGHTPKRTTQVSSGWCDEEGSDVMVSVFEHSSSPEVPARSGPSHDASENLTYFSLLSTTNFTWRIADEYDQNNTNGPKEESRSGSFMFGFFGPKGHQHFNKPSLTRWDVSEEQRATVVPTAAASEQKDASGHRCPILQPLDQGPPVLAGRKRRHEAIREYQIPTSVAVFESIEPTENAHFLPNRLYSVDNKGKMTSRLFSPVSKLDYGNRRRFFSVETPSPTPSSEGEMDPDSPTMLKAQRIKASWEARRKMTTPEPVPQPKGDGVWLEALRQNPHPSMVSRCTYRTPTPGPMYKKYRRHVSHQVEDEDSDTGIDGMVHFHAPSKEPDATASDDDGVLHFAPEDSEEDEAEAGDDTAANDHAAEAWRGFTEADLKAQYGPDTVWDYDRNGDLCMLI